MTIQQVNIGTVGNDGTGDTLRDAGGKINSNFTAISNASITYTTRTALLAASVPANASAVMTAGYASVSDGGGAYWVRSVSEPAHAGKAQSADGSWWELSDATPNIKQFGAKGDGVTDDTAAIQAAIDAGSNRWLFVPPGDYRVSGVVKLAGTNHDLTDIIFYGAGAASRIVLDGSVQTNIIEIVDGSGFVVRDLAVVGNRGTWTPSYATDAAYRNSNGVYVGGHHGNVVNNVLIENVSAEGCALAGFMIGSGPLIAPDVGSGVRDVRIAGCRSYNNHLGAAGGLQINVVWDGNQFIDNASSSLVVDEDSHTVSVVANSFDGATAGSFNSYCMHIYDVVNVTITGNAIRDGKVGIKVSDADKLLISGNAISNCTLEGISIAASSEVNVSGNKVSGTGSEGIDIENSFEILVVGNIVDTAGYWGISLTANTRRGTISGNTVTDNGYDGIYMDASSFLTINNNVIYESGRSGVFINASSNFYVLHNIAINNGSSGAGYDGIKITDSLTGTIEGNRCTDFQGTKTQEYGVRSTGTSTTMRLINNFLAGNATGAYSLTGSNSVLDVDTVGSLIFNGALHLTGSGGGLSGAVSYTGASNVDANSSGTGTVKFKGATSRDSAGFVTVYIGTTPYYIPVFSAITG